MKLIRQQGAVSQILQIYVLNSGSTTGAGLSTLAFNTASLTAQYHRDTDAVSSSIPLIAMTSGTFTSGGFVAIDTTNMPGWYQFCPPNACFSAGNSVGIHLQGAANMAPLPLEIDLAANVSTVANSVGSVTGNVGGSVGSVIGNVGGNVVGSVSSVTAGVTVTTNNDKTGYAVSTTSANTIADTFLDRNMATGTDSGTSSIRTPRQALRALRNKWNVSSATYSVFKEDDATLSWSGTVSASTGATPIIGDAPN